eukprot:m.322676 g.322676  ORF g.322676 m.322676 type:complete len:387 (+) comp27611_c0_seq13:457-1617(+)
MSVAMQCNEMLHRLASSFHAASFSPRSCMPSPYISHTTTVGSCTSKYTLSCPHHCHGERIPVVSTVRTYAHAHHVSPSSATLLQDQLVTMRHQSRLRLVRRKTDDQPPLASTDVDTLFDTLDLDNDGRVFLTEVVTSLSATVDTDIDAMTQTADGIFNDTVRQVPPAAGMQISAPISPPPHETVGRAAALNAVASPQASRNFQAADVDNDGVLTRHEFAFFLYPFLGPVFRERHAIAFIERLDNNTDGLVSAEEFVACALQVKGDGGDRNSVQGHDFRAEQEEWSREFREEFDRNQDGVLNLGEVQALLSPEHTAHGIAEGYKLVLQADTNGDHELSRDELTTAYSAFKDSTLLSFGAHAAADAEALLQGLADGIIQHISRVRDEL